MGKDLPIIAQLTENRQTEQPVPPKQLTITPPIPICPFDTYGISDLAELLFERLENGVVFTKLKRKNSSSTEDVDKGFFTDIWDFFFGGDDFEDDAEEKILKLLKSKVNNHWQEAVFRFKEAGRKKKGVHPNPAYFISATEAYDYIVKIKKAGTLSDPFSLHSEIAREFNKLFFGGMLFSGNLPNPISAKVIKFGDLDTANVLVKQDSSCHNDDEIKLNVRVTGINGPEIAYRGYSEFVATQNILCFQETSGREFPYGVEYPDTDNDNDPASSEYPGGKDPKPACRDKYDFLINPKLVWDVIKTHRMLAKEFGWDPKNADELSFWDRFGLNYTIAMVEQYTAYVSALPTIDMLEWEGAEGNTKEVRMYFSQVRGGSGAEGICGSWQPVGGFERVLGGFLQTDTKTLLDYTRTRLAEKMRENYEGINFLKGEKNLWEQFRPNKEKAQTRIHKWIRNAKVKAAAQHVLDSVLPPHIIYSKEAVSRIAKAYEQFIKDHKEEYPLVDRDMQVWGILIGAGEAFNKYRTNMHGINNAAQKIAQGGKFLRPDAGTITGFGLWPFPTFMKPFEAGIGSAYYNPADCMATQ